jgi:hypothetical protein
MAKKRASQQPIVAEEPARPDEQFRVEQSAVAPPSSRPIGPRSNVTGSGGAKSYGARSARERRTASTPSSRRSTTTRSTRSSRRSDSGPRPDIVANMLEHPTIMVTEDQLRKEYGYVTADLRSMGITAVALIAALVVLAQILPK